MIYTMHNINYLRDMNRFFIFKIKMIDLNHSKLKKNKFSLQLDTHIKIILSGLDEHLDFKNEKKN
jgi:hypothetical protein